MGKNKRDQKRKKSASNRKSKAKPNDNSRKSKSRFWIEMNQILNHIFSESWIGVILVGFTLTVVFAAILSGLKPVWQTYAAVAIIFNLFLFAAFYAADRSSTSGSAENQIKFAVSLNIGFGKPPKDDGPSRMRMVSSKISGKPIAYNVWMILVITFTNRGDKSCSIDEYAIETKQADGNWEQVRTFPENFGQLYYAFEPNEMIEVTLMEFSFFSQMKKQSIPPGQSVKGYVILGAPDHGLMKEFRLRARNQDRTEAVEEIPRSLDVSNLQDARRSEVQLGLRMGKSRDLSQIPIREFR